MDHPGFPIVGIGASAGGIEALEGFFRGLPADPGFAIVIVTHLGPERESLLHEVVSRLTTMSVTTITDDVEVKPNCVFVLTSSAILTIEHKRLQVQKNAGRRERKPIDIFFSSLAIDVGEMAAGVVLSGGDGDGTLGIKAIKERGGITLAQVADSFGPNHPDMPESAIATGFVDFAIPVEKMGEKLVEFGHGNLLIERMIDQSHRASDEQSIHTAMPEIYAILRNQIGHDFSGYKVKTFMRRVLRRMQIRQHATIEGYVERLRQEPPEVNALFRDLLINVTNFFRDADAFEGLAASVIPKLFDGRGADDTVRVWVPGCSTGEEVFSIAMLLREYMDKLSAIPRVQVFATDIDERALSVARVARYPEALLDSVSVERRKRFFILDGGSYVVSKDVRELCIFSPHSVVRDPPFSRIDLVSCRNLLIYFGADVQNQVIPTFHYALRPDGYLFLGSAENVSQFAELFIPIEKKHRIFRRRSDVASNIRLPILINTLKPGQLGELVPRRPPLSGLLLRQSVDEYVLDRFSPAHVVTNRDGDVIYYSSKTGKYLEAPPGAPTRQLLTLARRGLRLDLRTAFREAVETGRAASREGVALESDAGGVQIVDILVDPFGDSGNEPLYMIVFLDQGPVLSREEALMRANSAHQGVALHVERELRETRDRLQSMIEEYETALEELKSSNEELVSVNEEMQSTNEELEASKEELQSVNEELHTVNAELSTKVDALDRANSDLQNLFESTDVATVFLDRALTIRSFTPTVAGIFNILPGDRGRPITDLSSRLNLAGLAGEIRCVLDSGEALERRVQTEDGATHYLVRLSPYRDGIQKIEGVVIAFVDITTITVAEARQNVLIAELQHRTRNLLTVVQSISRRTIGKGEALDAFSARLASLGRVQSLVSGGSADKIDLGDLIRFEIEAIGATESGKVQVKGPPIALNFELLQTLGLALHELTTNALKYGALKYPDGALAISWDVRYDAGRQPMLALDWKETGVPISRAPPRKGFGRELIERALVASLQASTKMTFGSDGLSCHIELPLGAPVEAVSHKVD
ncbi:chemotaxis protein CheR [Bradyrhizobium rifense]|uniref:histidine kinase n=1 Tax=Bradyrhizobium rifense TaxID=515499 RepID=A0A5D3KW37_9BRAD|nr:CheR family methyltransferase [Bradyrhizobium rifense]TYM00141.1 chemotaxis protein CheR [Bradyrhizobium rifense]